MIISTWSGDERLELLCTLPSCVGRFSEGLIDSASETVAGPLVPFLGLSALGRASTTSPRKPTISR